MTIEQAKAICEISEQIIESAKVEVSAMHVLAKAGSDDLAVNLANKSQLFLNE